MCFLIWRKKKKKDEYKNIKKFIYIVDDNLREVRIKCKLPEVQYTLDKVEVSVTSQVRAFRVKKDTCRIISA